jgi:hypothetical protein
LPKPTQSNPGVAAIRGAKAALLLLLPLVVAACGKQPSSAGAEPPARDDHRAAAIAQADSHAAHSHAAGDGPNNEGGRGEADHPRGHDHDDEGEEGASVASFDPEHGLTLSPEARSALELETVRVGRRDVRSAFRLLAQVFAVQPRILATITLPAEEAGRLSDPAQGLDLGSATLVRVDRGGTAAGGQAELIVELVSRPRAPAIGDFVSLEARLNPRVESPNGNEPADTAAGSSAPAAAPRLPLAIPRSALLETAGGSFVFRVEGAFFRRQAVVTRDKTPDWVALSDGLREGDLIVASPVGQLWLTELRLTKGGGHSH